MNTWGTEIAAVVWSPPLAPLLGELSSASETEGGLAPPSGELSSASETEGSPWLGDCQWGKEWSGCVLSFLFCSMSESGDPFGASRHFP